MPDPTKQDHSLQDDPNRARIWEHVSSEPLHSMWDLSGIPRGVILKRSAKAFLDDNLVARAAELGYYFLFALFPTLVFGSSVLGLAAKKASDVYIAMLNYLAFVIPHSAFQMVLDTFNQTTQAASGGKLLFGLAAALWSASVGFGAIQDTANIVYKVKETRPYWRAKLEAIGVTILLAIVTMIALGVLLTSNYAVHRIEASPQAHFAVVAEIWMVRIVVTIIVLALLMLLFAIIYYFAPDLKKKFWHWLSPGAAVGIFFWFLASLALRVYLHYFDSYSATYGSLGAVIVLLTWFYMTGLMLLTGAEINSEIQAAAAERHLKAQKVIPPHVQADPGAAPVGPESHRQGWN